MRLPAWLRRPTDVQPRESLAVTITASEVDLIEWLLYAGHNLTTHRVVSARPVDATPVHDFVRALHMRVGAAAALEEEPAGIPLYEHEITTIEHHVRLVVAHDFVARYEEVEDSARLLARLHVRLGYAEATAHLGRVTVFRDSLPALPHARGPQEARSTQ